MFISKSYLYILFVLFLTTQPASAFDLTKSLGGIKEGLGNIINNDAETQGQETGKDEITKTTSKGINENDTIETTAPKSKKKIKPFGGIEWDDDLATVVGKINGFEGIDKVELALGDETTLAIKGITEKNALSQQLGKLLEKLNPSLMDPKSHRADYLKGEYVGPAGEKRAVILKELTIKASTVIIANVPFELEAYFELAPGLELKQPNNVLVENSMKYYFPVVLTGVKLYSNSIVLKDNCAEIIRIIFKKYADMYSDTSYSSIDPLRCSNDSVRISDRSEEEQSTSYLKIGSDREGRFGGSSSDYFSMTYFGNFRYIDELGETQRKHLVDIESKKFKGKKDMGSDL